MGDSHGKMLVRAEFEGRVVCIFQEGGRTFAGATVVGGEVVRVDVYKDERDATGLLLDTMSGTMGVEDDGGLYARCTGRNGNTVVMKKRVNGSSERDVWVAAHAHGQDVSLRVLDSRRDAMLCAACLAMGCAHDDVITIGDDVFRISTADDGHMYVLYVAKGWLSDDVGTSDMEIQKTGSYRWTVEDALRTMWNMRSNK